jgi:hypothetical protein
MSNSYAPGAQCAMGKIIYSQASALPLNQLICPLDLKNRTNFDKKASLRGIQENQLKFATLRFFLFGSPQL